MSEHDWCPFCGSSNFYLIHEGKYCFIRCQDCGGRGACHTTEEVAWAAWDQRAADHITAQQRDDLLELVENVELVGGPPHCPWCYLDLKNGHSPDCPRQAALALIRGHTPNPGT